MQEKEIGIITHYFGHVNVGIVKLSDTIKVGEKIHIKGHATDITQDVDSMQIEHASVSEAKNGDSVGVKVTAKVHLNDKVYKVIS
jgi:translation elongation factor EF-1alpha